MVKTDGEPLLTGRREADATSWVRYFGSLCRSSSSPQLVALSTHQEVHTPNSPAVHDLPSWERGRPRRAQGPLGAIFHICSHVAVGVSGSHRVTTSHPQENWLALRTHSLLKAELFAFRVFCRAGPQKSYAQITYPVTDFVVNCQITTTLKVQPE